MSIKAALTNLVFRRAKSEDLPKIIAIYADDSLGKAREYPEEPLLQSYYDAFAEIDADQNHELIVVELGNKIVGTLQLIFLTHLSYGGSRIAHVESVRVDKNFRNKGIGGKMMEYVINKAKEKHCRCVQLTTNKIRKDAHRFYKKLGFVASHEGMKLTLYNEEN